MWEVIKDAEEKQSTSYVYFHCVRCELPPGTSSKTRLYRYRGETVFGRLCDLCEDRWVEEGRSGELTPLTEEELAWRRLQKLAEGGPSTEVDARIIVSRAITADKITVGQILVDQLSVNSIYLDSREENEDEN